MIPSQRFLKQQQQQQQALKQVDQHGKPIEKKPHPADAQKMKPVDPRRRYHQPPGIRYTEWNFPKVFTIYYLILSLMIVKFVFSNIFSVKPAEKRSTTPPLELLPKEDRLELAAQGYAVPLDDIKVDKVTFNSNVPMYL